MFAVRSNSGIVLRVVLIAVIVFNALIPSNAAASSRSGNHRVNSSSASPVKDAGGSRGPLAKFIDPIRAAFQENSTPTALPTDIETSTSEPSVTPTPVLEDVPTVTPTPTFEGGLTPTPSGTPTISPSGTPIPFQTPTLPTEPTGLSVEFSASPGQVTTGSQVVFTSKVMNNGKADVTGLRFSNTLPTGFEYVPGDPDEFVFDAKTRELAWFAGKEKILLPGESLILQYTVVVESETKNAQFIDTASLNADGLTEPLTAEATVTLVDQNASLTALDAAGGEATGLNGRVMISLPKNGLDAPGAISIRDLKQETETPLEPDGNPWLVFELVLLAPQASDAQSSTPVGVEATATQPSESPVQATPTRQDSGTAGDATEGTPTPAATSIVLPQETPTPIPDEDPGLQENDRVILFELVEAEFKEPVEIIVSFDGLIDLAALGAEITPFLVTLDEESGTWVRVPLKTIEREDNRITVQVTHFSTWGVGFGPSTPQNGANILLFDDAYPSLFTGASRYSIPIWTPPVATGWSLRWHCPTPAVRPTEYWEMCKRPGWAWAGASIPPRLRARSPMAAVTPAAAALMVMKTSSCCC